MPRVTPSGVIAAVAGIEGSVDLVRFAPGVPTGGWQLLLPGVVIGQRPDPARPDGPWNIYTQNLSTGAVKFVAAGGCDFIHASGDGAWVALLVSDGYARTSWGAKLVDQQPIAGGDGFAITRGYQSALGITAWTFGGAMAWQDPSAEPIGPFLLSYRLHDGFLSYRTKAGFKIVSLLTGQACAWRARGDGVDVVAPFLFDGRLWLLERDYEAQLTLRQADQSLAYIIEPGPTYSTFSPDAAAIDGQAIVTWSVTEGEEVQNVVRRPLTLDQILALPTVETAGRGIPSPLAMPTAPLPACWVGGTNDHIRVGGNAAWSAGPGPDDRPVMEGTGYKSSVAGRRLLSVEWSTEAAAGGLDDLTLRAIPWALEQSAPAIYLHLDAPDQRPLFDHGLALVIAAGVTPVLGAHAVQDPVAFETQCRAFAASGHKFGITINYRLEGKNRPLFNQLLQRVLAVWRECGPAEVWFFGLDECDDPELLAFAAAVFALTSVPAEFPGAARPVVIPPPPIAPQPSAPVPAPRPHATTTSAGSGKLTKGQTRAAAVAAGGGLVVLVGKLFHWW